MKQLMNQKYDPQADPKVTWHDDGSVTIKLLEPIETKVKGKEAFIEELKIRKPRAGDLEVADTAKGDVSAMMAIIAGLSGIAVAETRRLELPDWNRVNVIVKSFFDAATVSHDDSADGEESSQA